MKRQQRIQIKDHATRRFAACLVAALTFVSCLPAAFAGPLIFSCSADNDLFRVASANGMELKWFDTPNAAVDAAPEGSGVLILADGYPAKTTALDAALFDLAARKKLRLYVEYPAFLPGVAIGAPRGTHWERAVIASDTFGPALAKLRILAIHGCRFVPLKAERPHIVIGRVAGFDTAVYGLAKESFPILCELPKRDGAGDVLVATTKLSHFLTGRYAPNDAWRSIWNHVFAWLRPGQPLSELTWTAHVRPSYRAEEPLSADVEQQALQRGIDWYFNSRMVAHPSMTAKYDRPANRPEPAAADPDLKQDWPYGHRTARMPDLSSPPGDGSLGVMEGFNAKIFSDGTQPALWWKRNDCNGEIAGAMAAAGVAMHNPAFLKTGGNIGDWIYFRSMMSLGDRADPRHPAFGLIGWNDSPQYCGPGSMDGYAVYYGDDNARSMLGMMLAAAALKTDRYDERLLQCLLANLRVSGQLGFQPDRLDQGPLEQAGWQHYFNDRNVSYSPHYQASLWACYLWAYRQTSFELFLQRAKTAIRSTMAAYPDRWVWTNGIQQERAKMLLALAWLVRVADTPEHRAWLRHIAEDLLAGQDPCGAIREEIGRAGKGGFPPPASNEAYGTAEAPLIQSNTDAASDLLYTCNFAFVALHEATAATGDPFYRTAADRLATFLCRIQIRSENHPELDGGWFRAFDFKRWEYWASSTDAGWGAWCIESGWTQSWITCVLALRRMQTSLWDLTARSGVGRHFAKLRPQMIPDGVLVPHPAEKVRHATVSQPKPAISLTLIPPSPVTDQITLDIRAAARNDGHTTKRFAVAVYLDEEKPEKRLHLETLELAPKTPEGIKFRWPTKNHAGRHRVLLVAQADEKTLRVERPLEIIASDARSTRRLGGAWVDLYHHDPAEGKPFDEELGKMTDAQWRELVRAMHEVDQNLLVITMLFQNFTHRGRHRIEIEGYHGKAYYPSKLFPGRVPIAAQDPLEAILSEADKQGMHVMPGVGIYAFFDFTPGSLQWHKQVAGELWERYGHHPSFYGWYVSEEKDGGLGNAEERREIVAFFREFTAHLHRLAPDKPVMLAPNCFHLRGAEPAYRELLPHLDILCPFGFHRMPGGDLRGEEAAALMQSLCDEAGCHLWMDLESFVFRNGVELHPRPILGLISDFSRFPNFEKTLHYQFPGLMCAPWMSRKPGGEPAVKLYNDYRRFLIDPKP